MILNRLPQKLAALACAGFACDSTHAAVVFSGDFNAGTGQVQFGSDTSFTLTSGLVSFNSLLLVFDEAVNSDSTRDFFDSDSGTPLSLELNGTPYTTSFRIVDNFVNNVVDVTAKDTYLFWDSHPADLSSGDTLVVKAGTYGVQSGTGFNTQLNALTFTGNMFLANPFGSRISSFGVAVPEPSVYATLTGFGLLLSGIWLSSRPSSPHRPQRSGQRR